MTEEDNNPNEVPPAKEPAATPLFSVEELDVSEYPIVHVPDRRLDALTEHARRLAEHCRGRFRDILTGKLGEFTVAKPLDRIQNVDVDVYPDGGDGGTDIQYRGATIDVKTVGRHRSDPALTVDAYEPLRADYYALASRISETDVRLIGYTPRCFVANAPIRYHDGEPYHFVDQRYLFPFPHDLI